MTRSRSAAAKVAETADALLDWLQTQSSPAEPRPSPPNPAGLAASAVVPELPAGMRSAGDLKAEGDACGDEGPGAVPVAPAQDFPEPGARPDPREAERAAAQLDRGHAEPRCAAPLRLTHTDWLYHRLTISGSAEGVAAFRDAAGGAGVIPWHLDLDRLEEDCFHLLVSPPAPQHRTLSLAEARIAAGQLRDAVARRHDLAVARVGRSRACPLDLHALAPVPGTAIGSSLARRRRSNAFSASAMPGSSPASCARPSARRAGVRPRPAASVERMLNRAGGEGRNRRRVSENFTPLISRSG